MFRERQDVQGHRVRVVEPVYNQSRPKEDQSFLVRMAESTYLVPKVIRLVVQIRQAMRNLAVPLSKKNVMVRDRYRCVYCGSDKDLTIDHVLPVSRGGKQVWENLVTACISCNQKKRDRTPSEAKMKLRKQPYQPSVTEHVRARLESTGAIEQLTDLYG